MMIALVDERDANAGKVELPRGGQPAEAGPDDDDVRLFLPEHPHRQATRRSKDPAFPTRQRAVTVAACQRLGRRASWNQTRTSAILAFCSGGAWRAQVDASGVPSAAPQRVSTQSLGL